MVGRYVQLVTFYSLLQTSAGLAQGTSTQLDSNSEHTARSAFEQGVKLLHEGLWAGAEARFRSSLALVRRASAQYDLAFVLFKQGRLHESAENLQQLLNTKDSSTDLRYREYAKELLTQVRLQVAKLYMTVTPANAMVRVDGKPLSLRGTHLELSVDPGAHHLDISSPGFVSHRLDVVTNARDQQRLEISLARTDAAQVAKPVTFTPAHASSTQQSPLVSVGPWLAIGLGGALLALAAVTGVLAEHADEGFTRSCPTHKDCDPSLKPMRDKVVALGTATNILLASGGAFALGGVTLRLLISASPAGETRGLTVSMTTSLHN
jgi:hypothetical protein